MSEISRIEAQLESVTSNEERVYLFSQLQLLLLDNPNVDSYSSVPDPRFIPHIDVSDRRTRLLTLVSVVVSFLVCMIVPIVFCPLLIFEHTILSCLGIPVQYQLSNLVQRGIMQMILVVSGVSIRVHGLNNVSKLENSRLFLYTHASNLDSFITASVMPSCVKFIAKSVLFYIPFFGVLMYLYGNVPINRTNLESAKKSYLNAAKLTREMQTSIAIAPEGRRSRNGLIQDFKKGPFHFALQTRLPLSPVILSKAYELWPPGTPWARGGCVDVRILPEILVAEDDSVASLMHKTRHAFLIAMSHPDPATGWENHTHGYFWYFLAPMTTLLWSILVPVVFLWWRQ